MLRRLRAGGILPDANGAAAGGSEGAGRFKGKGRAAVESRLSQSELDTSLERMFDGGWVVWVVRVCVCWGGAGATWLSSRPDMGTAACWGAVSAAETDRWIAGHGLSITGAL